MAKRRSSKRKTEESIGQLVRRLRGAAGLSLRELARRMGVGVATVASIEAGRQPRLSTLRLFAAHLPGATPSALLEPTSTVPPQSWPAAWQCMREHFRFEARSVTLTLHGGSWKLQVMGITCDQPDEPAVLLACARAACTGSPALIRGLTLPGKGRTFPDGPARHRFERKGAGLDYECLMPGEYEGTFLVHYPMKRLTLIKPLDGHRLGDLRLHAYPGGQPCEEQNEVTRWVHPLGVRIRKDQSSDCAVVVMELPPVGLRYALRWGGDLGGVGRSRRVDVARTVRLARQEAELTIRQVARIAGCGHGTVLNAERGHDLRLKTLRGLLRALPSLSPQDLLPHVAPPTCSPAELWEYNRLLFGIEATGIVKIVEVSEKPGRTTRIQTHALRSFREGRDDVQVRVGLRTTVLQSAPRVLTEVETSDPHVTVRQIQVGEGAAQHLLRLRMQEGGQTVTYTREYTHPHGYGLHRPEVPARERSDLPPRAGASIMTPYPVRRCRLVLHFPKGYEPIDLKAHAWPRDFLPDEALMATWQGLAPRVRTHRRAGRLSVYLTVDRPQMSMQHAISWQLP